MMYSVPLYFRITQFTSNTIAGAHLFPAVVGNTFGALIAAFIIQKTGRYRNLLIAASLISSSSYLLLILRWKGHTSWLESMDIVPGGFGTGMVYMATMISLMAGVKKEEIAVVTGGLYLCGGMGMVVGVAGVSSVQLGTLRPLLEKGLEGFVDGKRILEEVISNVGSVEGLEEGVRKVVVEAYVKSLEYSHSESFPLLLVFGREFSLTLNSAFTWMHTCSTSVVANSAGASLAMNRRKRQNYCNANPKIRLEFRFQTLI
jgi:hypothetical protein